MTAHDAPATMSIAEAIDAAARGELPAPVTFDNYAHIEGPFFHGTKYSFQPGDMLVPGHPSNHEAGRIANHVYFATLLEPAMWGAELANARSGSSDRGHIYIVEPTGPFEDDPNVTDKKFPGNVTRSYRTRHPMRVIRELHDWTPHPPDVVHGMLNGLDRLRAEGRDVIDDEPALPGHRQRRGRSGPRASTSTASCTP